MIVTALMRRLAPALALAAMAFGLAACNGGIETEGERVNRGVKEDAQGVRDFIRDRGVTVDTRIPER